MSTLLRLSTPRLKKSIERNGMKDGSISVNELRRTLERRGMSDRDMHSLFFTIITVLEPPACFMTHCKNYGGSGSPMNCGLERTPGRCSILKQFKERKAEREKSATEAEANTTGSQA